MKHSYLTKRGQWYYFRLRVPADLFLFLSSRFLRPPSEHNTTAPNNKRPFMYFLHT